MKTKKSLLALLLLAATSMFFGCGHHDPYVFDGINWNGSNSGTLELINGSNKDIILFVGQVPSQSSMLGGVRAGATVKHDISKHVSDFAVGGYAVLRGVTKEEYNKSVDPTNAKIEFTAMVTYRGGAIYRYNIDLNYMGDNGFRVTNKGRIGMELRKNSPEGEKVAYLPALQVNQMVYTQTTEAITLYPVYVFFNKATGEVSTLKSTTFFESVQASPRPLGPNANIQDYYFPNDETLTWAAIVGTLKQPVAYVTIINNIANQSGYVTNALSRRLTSQSGWDAIGSGEKEVFEVESTEDGSPIGLMIVFYGGNVKVPVRFNKDDIDPPVIKNGYNYSVTVSYTPGEGGLQNQNNYKAIIVEGSKRDVSDLIISQ